MELTNSFDVLLQLFAPVFTEPSFVTFRLMMTGWILSVRHRYVTDLIISSDSVGNGMAGLKPEELLSRIVGLAVVSGDDDEGRQIIKDELKSHEIDSVAECILVFEISVLKEDAEKARDIIRKSKRLRGKWVQIREDNGEWVAL